MRPNDSNSVSSSNVEFRIQNEDFPALPGANHVETGHGQMSLVCTLITVSHGLLKSFHYFFLRELFS